MNAKLVAQAKKVLVTIVLLSLVTPLISPVNASPGIVIDGDQTLEVEWGVPVFKVDVPPPGLSNDDYNVYIVFDAMFLYVAIENLGPLGITTGNVYIDSNNNNILDNGDRAFTSGAWATNPIIYGPTSPTTWGPPNLYNNPPGWAIVGGKPTSTVIEWRISLSELGIKSGDTIGMAFQGEDPSYPWYPPEAEPTTGPWTEHPENYIDYFLVEEPIGGEILPSTIYSNGIMMITGLSVLALAIGTKYKNRKLI